MNYMTPDDDGNFDPENQGSDSGLTANEQACMDTLVKFWNQYIALPTDHPCELDDCRRSVHHIQGLFALRVVERKYGDYWN